MPPSIRMYSSRFRTILGVTLILSGVGGILYLSAQPLPQVGPTSMQSVVQNSNSVSPNNTAHAETLPTSISSAQNTETTSTEVLPVFTTETLANYDGTDPSRPIYIAFEGLVYDVTPGKKFYAEGGGYHFLAGTDGTTLLRIAGGEIIKKKYTVVGTFTP